MIKLGDKVRVTRKTTVDHFAVSGGSIDGEVVEVDDTHKTGLGLLRELNILFTDGRQAWYGRWEVKKIHDNTGR